MEELRKPTINVSDDKQSPGRDFNLGTSEPLDRDVLSFWENSPRPSLNRTVGRLHSHLDAVGKENSSAFPGNRNAVHSAPSQFCTVIEPYFRTHGLANSMLGIRNPC
jgi:hypothetical protein